jgi:CO/xanthine dehydrogenase FAD-binding subunit
MRLYGPEDERGAIALPAPVPLGLEEARLVAPRSIEDACLALERAKAAGQVAKVLAGGTDWVVDRHLLPAARASRVDVVVDLTGIDALGRVEVATGDGPERLVLGAGVTYWTLRTDRRVTERIPMLARMARDVGAVQIQTRGTLGGNLASASPAADGVPALMALGATLTLTSAAGSRRVPIDAFFTGYRKTALDAAEILTAIELPVPPAGSVVQWQKVGTRLAQAISKVALASAVSFGPGGAIARAGFGMASVAATTAGLPTVRALVVGKRPEDLARADVDAAVAADITPIDDVRSTGAYRLHVAKALVGRALALPRDPGDA